MYIYLYLAFLIYHSPSYTVANAFMMLEHIITRYVFEFQYKVDLFLFSSNILSCFMLWLWLF